MPVLRQGFENNGFINVSTYINSGNILFSSEITDCEKLNIICEKLIKELFGLDIPVMTISAEALAQSLSNPPEWWNNEEGSSHNAIFVIPPYDYI